MNLTPDEQNALVQFFGTMHAQAKQTDEMIVGSSKFVNPVSPTIRRELEQVLRSNVEAPQPAPQPVYVPQEPIPAYVEPVTPQLTPNVNTVPEGYKLPSAPVVVYKTVEVDILEVLKEINLNLGRIATTIEKHNGSTKRTKATKSA
jgi:hypothetical protein